MPSRSRIYQHLAIWLAAALVGLGAILYAQLISKAQKIYFDFFSLHPEICALVGPFIFIAAVGLVVYFAPEAKGSGIPQVLKAIDDCKIPEQKMSPWDFHLVSTKTALIKIVSSTLGILGGASIGREGPTVQIACSGFAWVGRKAKKYFPKVDFQTYLIAGAATGVAAAFNTPLAGITFALEEITEHNFAEFKRTAMQSVIIGGITAQAIAGDYLYFGHPIISKPSPTTFLESLFIGALGGILGGIFAKLLAHPSLVRLPRKWVLKGWVCGVICSLITFMTHGDTAGSGYEITRQSLESTTNSVPTFTFPLWKLITTVFSYLSGMAGGIFSPCLSIGAGIGFSAARLAHFQDLKACAMIGMVAFFSGVVQAPLTAVIIVLEMADERMLILPFLISAFLAQGIGKLFMPIPLYRFLADPKKHH